MLIYKSTTSGTLAHPEVTIVSIKLFEELPQKPILSINQAVEILGLTKPPISKAIKVLVSCGILFEITGEKKDRQYRYQEYLTILAKDTD